MRRTLIVLFVVLAVQFLGPGWSGEVRMDLLGTRPNLAVTRVALDPADPHRRRVGALEFLGGIAIASRDPAFGGYSALHVTRDGTGNHVTMVSDGGNVVAFHLDPGWRPHAIAFLNLPTGPATGWEKRDRDSESLVVDDRTGQAWVGFERWNAIYRYARGFTRGEAEARPAAMRDWPDNGGAEAMTRLADGRFVVISEDAHTPPDAWHGSEADRLHSRDALIFAGDPTAPGALPQRFAYMIEGLYAVSDVTTLPSGDLIVVERAFSLPYHFANRLMLVDRASVRPGGIAHGRLLATLDAPLIHDNFEGASVTREGEATILWLVSDDNQSRWQRTLLLKFRLASSPLNPSPRP